MAEITYRSAGVSTREIDISGPTSVTPTGTPAAVIGTSIRGPAFIPTTVATFQDYTSIFGSTDGKKFAPLAAKEWLRNAGSAVFLKVLGIGDGQERTFTGDNAGKVNNAGFVVGGRLPQANSSGYLNNNPYAAGNLGEGRAYFLGTFMSESAGSTALSSAGIQPGPDAVAIIRGVLLAPSGVFPTLSALGANNTIDNINIRGSQLGTVDPSDGNSFILLLNGHTNNSNNSNVIKASFDPTQPNYFGRILNTDPLKIEEAGHCLYAQFDIRNSIATITGTNLTSDSTAQQKETGFILSGSLGRNVGSATHPNFENFEDRFRTAFSPWFISQKFGGSPRNLFKLHALDDGQYPNSKFKISIENLSLSRDASNPYGSFDVLLRSFNDTDADPVVLERFSRLNLDPNSDRFVARVIGDRHNFFNFDTRTSSQRIVSEGSYSNQSQLVRVEVSSEVLDGTIDPTALPTGFRGPHHLVTAGNGLLNVNITGIPSAAKTALSGAIQMPIPFRDTVSLGTGLKLRASNQLYWGVQFEVKDSINEPNRSSTVNESLEGFTKFFPYHQLDNLNVFVGDNSGAADVNGSVLDSDRFCNNLFSLERIAVVTGADGLADETQWASARYVRAGLSAPAGTRFLDFSNDIAKISNRPFVKFTSIMQGGFDGTNIFNKEKSEFLDLAVKREMDDSIQGETSGPTVSAYLKALNILGEKSNADVQILTIPGIRQPVVTNVAMAEVEERFDAIYLMDIQQFDSTNSELTGLGEVSVTYTAQSFNNRNLDSSFSAAYFPDVIINDESTLTNLVVPPSVAVLGAFALNDSLGFPWFAPAGFTRGALSTTQETAVKLNRTNLDTLQDADINPIVAFPGQGPTVFGQKTLLQASSALDRVNVRRLLINVRRQIRGIANSFIFEPNLPETLSRFQSAVQPILQTVQAQRGVERFKVIIDTSTTTQVDIENNTIRGKIFLQPTRSLEFISLDFVVANSGAII